MAKEQHAEDAASDVELLQPDQEREQPAASATKKLNSFVNLVRAEAKLFVACARSASPDRLFAVILFLFLFCLLLTCTVARYLTALQPDRFATYTVPWFIMGVELVGSISLSIMTCCVRLQIPDDDDANLRPAHRFIHRNLKLFGIVPFYFAILAFDIFHFIANVSCVDAWRACADGDVSQGYLAELSHLFVRTAFLGVEMIFCVRFNGAHLPQNTGLLVALAVVQATNFFSWMDAIVNESEVLAPQTNKTVVVELCLNAANVSNVSTHFMQCWSRTTGEYHLLERVTPYLFPFMVEYLMLVIESITDWFFTKGKTSDHAADGDHAAPSEHGAVTENEQSTATSHQVRVDSLSAASLTSMPSVSSDNVLVPDPKPVPWYYCHYSRCPRIFISAIFVPVVANLLLIIFGISDFILDNITYRKIFIGYRTFYWLLLCFASAVGYWMTRKFQVKKTRSPTAFEYFVALTSVGPFMQCIFTLIANELTNNALVPTAAVEAFTNIFQIAFQIIFYGYVARVEMPAGDAAPGSDEDRLFQRRRSILLGVLMYYAMCNIALWVEDSFIDTRNAIRSWQQRDQYYLDEWWPLIYAIFSPLGLMFRFNSVFLFLDAWFDKKR